MTCLAPWNWTNILKNSKKFCSYLFYIYISVFKYQNTSMNRFPSISEASSIAIHSLALVAGKEGSINVNRLAEETGIVHGDGRLR